MNRHSEHLNTMMRTFIGLILCISFALSASAETRPNVLVILVDDLGYSDLGCYGSEIETPNLDALAAGGLRFSQFYNTAKCHSSRVSLLTGQYCIAAGDTGLSHAVTSAEVLGAAGYFTAMTGKWHLKQEPTDFGFQRYFGHLSGACNYFEGDQSFRLNGEAWKVPEDDFYTTVANVDYAMDFLGEARGTDQPWYLYVAFNAPHAPLHALPEDYAKYKGRYRAGWDVFRKARFAKQKALGLLPQELRASPRPAHIPAWDEMSERRREYESDRMSTLAAMIDRVDQEVGRLVDDLRQHQELENTLILFVSDNGACPYDRKRPIFNAEPTNGKVSYGDSTGWAWARNCPFRFYKQNQFEGGIATPAIVHWPAGVSTAAGQIVDQPAHLIDVLPTVAELTDSVIPTDWPGREIRSVSGISLAPILRGAEATRPTPLHFLFSTDRGLRDGDWKAVSFRQEAWELYDMSDDRTELRNLAESEPERLEAMVKAWTEMTKNVLHAPKRAYAPTKPADLPHRHPQWTDFDKPLAEPGPAATRRRDAQQIRARKNTKLTLIDGSLHLQFSGEDPGIAMDLRSRKLPPGPYQLRFLLRGGGTGGGDVYYTTDPKNLLPRGEHVTFDVHADGEWQSVVVDLETAKQLQQLRIDVSPNRGEAEIDALELFDHSGAVLSAWPASE